MKQALMALAFSIILLAGVKTVFADDGEKFLKAAYDGDEAVIKSLLAKNQHLLSAKDTEGNTALHLAASEDHGAVVQYLLSKGAPVTSKNELGFTPLHAAIWKGRLEIVKILLAKGADSNARTTLGATPLSIAREAKVACDRKELIEVLKKYGAKD
jgi:ankyrin repeat protein